MRPTTLIHDNAQTLLIEGASMTDVVYTSEFLGEYNITAALAWVKVNLKPIPVRLGIDNVSAMLSKVDIDRKRVAELRHFPSWKFEPLLSCEIPDGPPLIIDGHHRMCVLLERAIAPYIDTDMHIIPLVLRRHFLVGYYRVDVNGNKTEINPGDRLRETFGKYTAPDGSRR